MKNKKLWITLGVVALVVIILISSIVGSYNGFVEKQTAVESQFAQVQNVLQRRSDLIPNLVNTVKGYTAHENEVYTAISDARAKLAGANTVEEATYTYNEAGQLSVISATSGNTTFEYNAFGDCVKETVEANGEVVSATTYAYIYTFVVG